MRQKNTKKHTAKKSPSPTAGAPSAAQPEFPIAADGTRPVHDEYASALQIAALLPHAAIDDSLLRRRATSLNPATVRPWIPAPVEGRYHVIATLAGLHAYLAAEHAAANPLPTTCASMKDAATKWPISHGNLKYFHENKLAPAAFNLGGSSRVDVLAYYRAVDSLLTKISTGNPAALHNLPGLETVDKDREQGLLARENRVAQAMENNLKAGHLHTREGIELGLGQELATLASALKAYPKRLRTILAPANVPPAMLDHAIAEHEAPLAELHARITAALSVENGATALQVGNETIWLGKYETSVPLDPTIGEKTLILPAK